MNLFSARPGYELFSFSKIKSNSINSLPHLDYNFALVPVFCGLVSILHYLTYSKSNLHKCVYSVILAVFVTSILLSGSRRGIIALAIIFIIVLSTLLISLFYKVNSNTKIYYNLLWFLLPLIVLTFSFFIFIFHTPYSFKINTFDFFNAKNVYQTKERITWITNSYQVIFNRNKTYIDTYNFIWKHSIDPKDPDSGWGTRNHRTIYPLTGNNVEIVPPQTKGYLLDNTCNPSTWDNNAYAYTLVGSDSVTNGQVVNASVYCYVSEDYDGTWARILIDGAAGFKNSNYNLSEKGKWQRLSATARCKNGVAGAYLYMSKYGVTDFANLKGNVIFAYPQYRKVEFDSNDPDTWGTREHKTIFPLTGNNVDIVPSGAKGYLLDKTCDVSPWNNNAYAYTLVGSDSVGADELINSSVFCYVSNDFDGSWVRLSSEGSTYGNTENYYDLNNKGSWQKLSLRTLCREGKAPVYMYFSKYGVSDFSSLKGYVIFAYPQYQIIRKDSLISQYYHIGKFTENSQKISKSPLYSGQKKRNEYYKSSILPLLFLTYTLSDSVVVDTDPIRNLFKRLVSEDTTYHGYSARIEVDSVANNFLAPRTVRWQFGWQIFIKEYNWYQKIFGNGFNFLNWYGYYFMKDKTGSDWPHNPMLSILLYSGIIGLFLYLFFLYKVFILYLRNLKEFYILFIFFLISFYFAFFSGGNPFDPPVMGFFVMLPFLLNRVQKNN